MEKFVQNYLNFYYGQRNFISESENELDTTVLLSILTKYSRNTSKHFLEDLFDNSEMVLEKLSVLRKYPELFSAIFLDDLYLEKLDSAGYTLLFLSLLVPINRDFVARYVKVCSNLKVNEEVLAIIQLLEVIGCQGL